MTTTATRPEKAEQKPEPHKTERINLRTTAEDAALIRQAAIRRRMTVTEFLLTAGVEEARRALDEDQRHEVLGEVYDRLMAEIKEPGQVVDAIAQMIKKPRRIALPSIED